MIESLTEGEEPVTLDEMAQRFRRPADPASSRRDEDGRRRVAWHSARSSRRIRTGATLLLFYEYFHGDTGAGIGASHQTGWTGVVASLIDEWRD